MFKVMMKGKVETVTADCVKPAHIERKPENDSTQQHKVAPKSRPTASKPTAKTREPPTAILRVRSTTMSKPSRTGVKTEKNSHARSMTQTKEAVPAVAQQSHLTEEQSLKPPSLCRSPHASTNCFLALTGRMKVYEHICSYLYICKPTCLLEFP